MYIDELLCINCTNCIEICPIGAILVDNSTKQVTIDQDLCVECGVCYRSGVCEQGVIIKPQLAWPRSIRARFSDPIVVNPETRIPGRGTEEMKTNDVTGRYKHGFLGIAVELGRPGIGASFMDIQKVTRACAQYPIQFCPENPITTLITDTNSGDINPEILGERVLSAIVELVVPIEHTPAILKTLCEVSEELKTVFSLNTITLVDPDESIPMFSLLNGMGFTPSANGKNNMGLGRPSFDFFGGNEK